jgi:hypothetical protein
MPVRAGRQWFHHYVAVEQDPSDETTAALADQRMEFDDEYAEEAAYHQGGETEFLIDLLFVSAAGK